MFKLHRSIGLDPGSYSGLSHIYLALEQCQTDLQFTFVGSVLCRSRKKCFMHHGLCPQIFRSDISHCLYQYRSNKLLSQFYNEKAEHTMYFLPVQRLTVIGVYSTKLSPDYPMAPVWLSLLTLWSSSYGV